MRLLPFDYAIRNLGRSPLRLAMSVAGSLLVVGLVSTAAACVRGLERSLMGSGSTQNVMLLGAGSEESVERSEISASVPEQAAATIAGIQEKMKTPFISPVSYTHLHLQTTPYV